MKNKRGGILLYTLVILSTMIFFMTELIFFTKNRYFEQNLREKSLFPIKNKILNTENDFENAVFNKGILLKKNKIKLSSKEQYYNSKVVENSKRPDNATLLRLMYLDGFHLSNGGFKIIQIKDKNGNSYSLPLKENTIYPDLVISYSKKVLKNVVLISETLRFTRENPDSVIINLISCNLEVI